MTKLDKEVRDNVTRLLAMLNPQVSEDSEEFQFVRDQLTRMAILGTLPPGSQPTANQRRSPNWAYEL